jgi:RimJ/RimL family protein N-acetyltransferase
MQACPANHPALPALFDPALPNKPALWAVFEGHHTGRALVDDLQHPTQCVLRTDACLTYPSRQISQNFLEQAITWFRKTDPVWLIWPASLSSRLVAPETGQIVQRLEFIDLDPHSGILEGLRQRLSDGFEIRPLDLQLIERCEWRSEMEFYCGSLENFLLHDFGLCLMRAGEIVTEAYASSIGDNLAEIGAITHEPFRGQGYAPVACAFLIQACERRGCQAYWSCDVDNPASIQVARKLGFRHERAYRTYEYRALQDI